MCFEVLLAAQIMNYENNDFINILHTTPVLFNTWFNLHPRTRLQNMFLFKLCTICILRFLHINSCYGISKPERTEQININEHFRS